MTLTTLCLASVLLAPPPGPPDYFPVQAGTTWTYEDESDGRKQTFTDKTLGPVKIGDRTAYPIESTGGGAPRQITYYAFEGDAVLMLGSDPKKPLTSPYAILRVTSKRTDWTYSGQTPFYNDPAPMTLRAEAAPKGERTVLGRKVAVIEVVLDAVVGGGETSVKNRQVALYGRGIGLIELRETARIGSNKYERTRRLTAFEPGPAEAR